jgi:hypothetical protein
MARINLNRPATHGINPGKLATTTRKYERVNLFTAYNGEAQMSVGRNV